MKNLKIIIFNKKYIFVLILLLMYLNPVNAAIGDLIWSYDNTKWLSGGTSVDKYGTIYFHDGDGITHAIYSNGTERWNYDSGSGTAIYSGITFSINEDVLYFGDRDNKLTALNRDGSLKWEFLTAGDIDGMPAVGTDDTIYFGCVDKKLYAVNPDGTEKWSYTGADPTYSSPAIDLNGVVYFSTSTDAPNNLYAIYPNGTLKWSYVLTVGADASPVIDDVRDRIYVVTYNEELHAVDITDGTNDWTYPITTGASPSYGSPAVDSNGNILFNSDWNAYSISSAGVKNWEYAIFDTYLLYTGIIGNNDYYYTASSNNNLYIIDSSGSLIDTYNLDSDDPSIGSMSLSNDGMVLYVGGWSGKLYAIEVNSPPLYTREDFISGVTSNYFSMRSSQITPEPEPTPVPTATEPPIAAPAPVLPPPVPTPPLPTPPIHEPILIIIEEFITFISTSYNWIFILLAYLGALIPKITTKDETQEILVDTALYGTIGWILVLILNIFIPIISTPELLSMSIFFFSGLILSALSTLNSKPENKKPRRKH